MDRAGYGPCAMRGLIGHDWTSLLELALAGQTRVVDLDAVALENDDIGRDLETLLQAYHISDDEITRRDSPMAVSQLRDKQREGGRKRGGTTCICSLDTRHTQWQRA